MVVGEANIHNIMGGMESTGGVPLHNHKRKLKQRYVNKFYLVIREISSLFIIITLYRSNFCDIEKKFSLIE